MDKQNHSFEVEVPASQEKTLVQISASIQTLTPVPVNNQTKLPLLIFSPLVLIFLALILLFFFNFCIFKVIFFIGAFISILIYSCWAFEIHNISNKPFKDNKWYLYNQYWLNGLGTFVGWTALYILVFHRIKEFDSWAQNLSSPDFIISLVAFLGITGYLPFVALLNGFLKH